MFYDLVPSVISNASAAQESWFFGRGVMNFCCCGISCLFLCFIGCACLFIFSFWEKEWGGGGGEKHLPGMSTLFLPPQLGSIDDKGVNFVKLPVWVVVVVGIIAAVKFVICFGLSLG